MLLNRLSLCLIATTLLAISEASVTKQSNDILKVCAPTDPRAKQVRDSFIYAYTGYKKYAFGHDEVLPVSGGVYDSRNGWGATIIDSLDTMLIMGLDDDFNTALDYLDKVDFSKSTTPSKGFETNIRYLGGLLSAYELQPTPILLKKAVEVADYTLIPLFVDTTSLGKDVKVPYTDMDLKSNKPIVTNQINLAEFGSYSMEFTKLSELTGDPKYKKLVDDMTNAAISQPTRIPGLFPTAWTVRPFAPVNSSTITMGGGGDSFYEYLIKNYILQNKENKDLLKVWEDSVESMENYMFSATAEDPDTKFVAEIGNDTVYYVSQELICFWPGNILLGIPQIEPAKQSKFKAFADAFFKSCIETWVKTETGIAPESWHWNPQDDTLGKKLNKVFENTLDQSNAIKKKLSITKNTKRRVLETFKPINSNYYLRPETIESVFYYYRATGDEKYQDLAWRLYSSIEKYTKSNAGYTAIGNVNQVPVTTLDSQESFFLAETLKYLYLTFVDKECVSLNNYVFNTEAHPFKLPEPIQYQ